MASHSNIHTPAESSVSWPILGLASCWALIVILRYFFWDTAHPLSQYLPAINALGNVNSFPQADPVQVREITRESLRILLTAFVIGGVTWTLGRRMGKWLGLNRFDPWVGIAFDFGWGVVFLDLFWVGTGLVRLWYPPVWISLFSILGLLFIWDLISCIKKGFKHSFNSIYPKEASTFILCLTGLFYWIFSILQDLAPETFYDSMVYHLAVPAYWLLHHGIMDFPTNFFSNYPFGGEIYFLNGMVLQGTETAKILHALAFGVCALLAGGWAREMAGERAAWLTLGLILTLPLFALATWTTAVEGFLAFAMLLFLYSLLRWVNPEEPNQMAWALATGVFAGLAFSTKYTSLLGFMSIFFVLTIQKSHVFFKAWWVYWSIIFAAGLLLVGPWVLKNLAFTGNPFFPYWMSRFSGRSLPQFGYDSLLREQHGWAFKDLGSWILLPWNLTMSNPDSFDFCGPLALAFTPFLFLFKIRNPVLRFLAWVTPLLFLSSLAITNLLKFMLTGFILLYILVGSLLGGGNRPGWGKGASWVGGLTALLCFAYLAGIARYYYFTSGIWTGRQTRADYLTGPGKISPYLPMAQWISKNVPTTASILIAGATTFSGSSSELAKFPASSRTASAISATSS